MNPASVSFLSVSSPAIAHVHFGIMYLIDARWSSIPSLPVPLLFHVHRYHRMAPRFRPGFCLFAFYLFVVVKLGISLRRVRRWHDHTSSATGCLFPSSAERKLPSKDFGCHSSSSVYMVYSALGQPESDPGTPAGHRTSRAFHRLGRATNLARPAPTENRDEPSMVHRNNLRGINRSWFMSVNVSGLIAT